MTDGGMIDYLLDMNNDDFINFHEVNLLEPEKSRNHKSAATSASASASISTPTPLRHTQPINDAEIHNNIIE